jgi:hypothetical protein
MRQEGTLQWLHRLSEFIRKHPSFDPKTMERSSASAKDEEREEHPANEATKDFEQLRHQRPLDTDKNPLPIDDIAGVWTLLRIPFSVPVAAASRSESDTRDARHETPHTSSQSTLSDKTRPSLSTVILNNISVQLGKPADQLTQEDLSSLQRLDLSGTGVVDVSSRSQLSWLQILDLRETGVVDDDVAAFRKAREEAGLPQVELMR